MNTKHKLLDKPADKPAELTWHLCLDQGTLRIIGDDGENSQTVISVYPSGKSYRHHSVKLRGLDVNSKGQVKEFATPHAAHTQGGGR